MYGTTLFCIFTGTPRALWFIHRMRQTRTKSFLQYWRGARKILSNSKPIHCHGHEPPWNRHCISFNANHIIRMEFGLVSAQLSMAYVCLEDKDYPKAFEYAELVSAKKNNNQQPPEGLDSIRRTVFQRQQATTRLYASEASCALGNPMTAMKYLVGDGKDDAFDRLASHLISVTLETAASHPKGKARLAKAQAMVRCSASLASANLGNALAAK
jgi:hypothetical protein